MRTAEVVVIGGGVVGLSVAYHLAARGCRDVVVLDEREGPGQGSTCRATGGFRAQFGTAVNVHLSQLARGKLKAFREETGVDAGYQECGYLFLSGSPAALAELEEARTVQRSAGFSDAVAVDARETADINPHILLDGVTGGSWCPTDGFIRPLEMVRGYEQAGRRLGVEHRLGERCLSLEREGERITAVRTTRGTIGAGAVVNAAGAWAASLARSAGVELPVRPLRRQVAATAPSPALPERMPLTIFIDSGFHMRVRDGRALLLYADTPAGDDPFHCEVVDDWVSTVTAKAHAHVPALRSVPVERAACWAGLYEMSPDGHAILGRAPELSNFYLANGSSGHGVMHSPALGHLLAEIILDGEATTLDARPLRPERFAEGEPNEGSTLL